MKNLTHVYVCICTHTHTRVLMKGNQSLESDWNDKAISSPFYALPKSTLGWVLDFNNYILFNNLFPISIPQQLLKLSQISTLNDIAQFSLQVAKKNVPLTSKRDTKSNVPLVLVWFHQVARRAWILLHFNT